MSLHHRDEDTSIRSTVNVIRNASAFATEKKYVFVPEGVLHVRFCGLCGGENKSPARGRAPCLERLPVDVADKIHTCQIIHSRPLQVAVRDVEPSWFNDVDTHAQTGREAEYRSRIAGNIRLIERDAKV